MKQFYDKLTCFFCRFRHGKFPDVRSKISRRAEIFGVTCGKKFPDVRKKNS